MSFFYDLYAYLDQKHRLHNQKIFKANINFVIPRINISFREKNFSIRLIPKSSIRDHFKTADHFDRANVCMSVKFCARYFQLAHISNYEMFAAVSFIRDVFLPQGYVYLYTLFSFQWLTALKSIVSVVVNVFRVE